MAYKGVAVSQIILLVLGILVLAVVAYLLYTNFVSTGTTISAETCRAEATRTCTGCIIAGKNNKECPYTSATMDACVDQGRVTGSSSGATGTIDCTYVTGTNPLDGTGSQQQDQQKTPQTTCDSAKCAAAGGSIHVSTDANNGKCKITTNGVDSFTCP